MMRGDTTAEVRRHLAAEPERVFAAFADPGVVARWLTPSPEIKLTVLQFDFREGGRYRFAYTLPDGVIMRVGGSYRTIVRPSHIVFSWVIEPPDAHAGIESEVAVAIARDGAGTRLVIRHSRWERDDAVERHAEGWRGALDQLGAMLGE
jgi:uncharacterized protein YndB with AHSA1/START domain